MKHNRKLTRSLLVLVLLVWGCVAYRIAVSMDGADMNERIPLRPTGAKQNRALNTYHFIEDVRDPFHYKMPTRKDTSGSKSHSARPKIVWAPPPFKLNGILYAERKRTAMLEGPNGSIYFLREGDTLGGVKVLKIKSQSVTYSFEKKTTDWVLEHP